VTTVAEAHGGRVAVESRFGEGSRFTMVLPREPKWRES
jgi:signal transduction histidine kinase